MSDHTTLRYVLRQVPFLTQEDSVYRAVEMLRHGGADTAPVLDTRGLLVGVLTLRDLLPLIDEGAGPDAVYGCAAAHARKPATVGDTTMSAEQARSALAASGETTLFIVDRDGRYVGSVALADLLVPGQMRARPPAAGGMATPWGVHLNTGTLQAGSGMWELLASGAVLGVMMVSAYTLVGVAACAMQAATRWPVFRIWLEEPPAHLTLAATAWYLLHTLSGIAFLVLLRLMPIAGYHAAEHQAVHAMERGEPLHVSVLRRMPRVHPRCGTNLMAAGMIFAVVSQLVGGLRGLGLDSTDGAVLGGLTALFTWRSLGAFLQLRFTTKPATDRQLAAGVAAAEELERRYSTEMPGRPTLLRRIWCMGLVPTVIGAVAGSTASMYAAYWLLDALSDRIIH